MPLHFSAAFSRFDSVKLRVVSVPSVSTWSLTDAASGAVGGIESAHGDAVLVPYVIDSAVNL